MQGVAVIERLVRGIGVAAACILIPGQVVVSLTYLLGSRVFRVPITPLQELEWHFFFALVFLTLGAALVADQHVRMALFDFDVGGTPRSRRSRSSVRETP